MASRHSQKVFFLGALMNKDTWELYYSIYFPGEYFWQKSAAL